VRTTTLLTFVLLLAVSTAEAQAISSAPSAEQIIQPSQTATLISQPSGPELKIPAGTPIEVEVAYTVNSLDMKPGERISFRVLIPILVDGVTVIEKGALVTAHITQAKRGGHWGKAGKLSWSMEDVVAIDATRIPLAPDTASRKLWSLETKTGKDKTNQGGGSVNGTSHGGEVAAMSILSGALFPPLALMGVFKRGDNAILREGRRYVVEVGKETTIKVEKVVSRVAEN